jgi:chromosome segregation ATPase
VFRKLCGEQTLKNVVITTNMWGKITPEVGEAREQQLSTLFFKPAIDKGAQFLRHVESADSAHAIIRAILDNHPLALQIQEELVDQHMEFSRTAAGQEIRRALNEHADKLEDKIRELQSELQDAEKKERETQQELEEEVRRLRERLDSVKSESMQLETRYQGQRNETQGKTDALLNDLLKTLLGVFKLGFFSGFLLSGLLGIGAKSSQLPPLF